MVSTSCFLQGHALATLAPSSSQKQLPSSSLKSSLLVCRAAKQTPDSEPHAVSRRLSLALLAGITAIASKSSPASAAYGEAANIFGKPKENTDFIPYNGDGFSIALPSKWNPSKEVEFPGQVLRYEDNFDSNSSVSVIICPTDKKSIADYGSPEEFLGEVDYLLGKQVYAGKTQSEGGFDPDSVAAANVLESSSPVIKGKQYYFVSVLTRTADGGEGGKHQLITAAVQDGKLFICKAQAGDKRWFKGARKYVESTSSSFSLA